MKKTIKAYCINGIVMRNDVKSIDSFLTSQELFELRELLLKII